MDTKQHIDAANALVQWFNSQEIAPSDAERIMLKVIAKILVGALSSPNLPSDRSKLDTLLDMTTLQLVHDVNDRLFATRKDTK